MTSLIDDAEGQLGQPGALANVRACWLARAALEDAIGSLLPDDPGHLASARSRLSCLQVAYADRPEVASRAEYAWSRLSEACHQHAYALSPTYIEAQHLVGLVRQFVAAAEAWRAAPPPPGVASTA